MTSDLAGYRALAERARENTSDGLTAREALPNVVDALLNILGTASTEWGAGWQTDLGSGVLPRDDKQDARTFIVSLPASVQHMRRAARRAAYRHEGPWEAGDE